jgi:hypothetical protein
MILVIPHLADQMQIVIMDSAHAQLNIQRAIPIKVADLSVFKIMIAHDILLALKINVQILVLEFVVVMRCVKSTIM